MRAFIKKILPAFLVSLYKGFKKRRRAKGRDQLKEEGLSLNLSQLTDQIRACGIREGEVVMLHSSLSSIGFVEGGAETVIKAFQNVIGNSGTLAMPSFPGHGFTYDYLSGDPLFDVLNTASQMGVITEYFRKMPGVKRSFHPTDPVCASGPEAEFLTGAHFGEITPYNANSPFYKLCLKKAKIVMLGVDLNALTNLHTPEDAVENFKYPVYHQTIFDCRMIDEHGKELRMKTKCHDPQWSRKRRCNALIPYFRNAGFLTEGKIGMAPVMVIGADKMHEWMVKNYEEKGITMYTPEGEK